VIKLSVELSDFNENPTTDNKKFDSDIFKKWFKTKDRSGFLSVNGWLEAGKMSIDIGELGQGELKSSTKVWSNAVELATFLKAVRDGLGAQLYPKTRPNADLDESFIYYGGGKMDDKPVSRILKVHHWEYGSKDNRQHDSNAFAWKTAHFAAKQSQSGAYVPDMSKGPLSLNMIKVSRLEMAEISYRVDLAINSFAARNDNIFRMLNGEDR